MKELSERINQLQNLLEESDHVIIGGGAGLSTAAGINYGGERFTSNFKEFIEKYNFTDMYTAGFYPFKSQEEKWAYWAKHVYMNNIGMGSTELYKKLYDLVKDKNYFVITTNVDDQFVKSCFDDEKVFSTQGSYRLLQCKNACHDKLYDDTEIVKEMIANTDSELKIPTDLVPKCPVCGGDMELNLRIDNNFVEDETWHKHNNDYRDFVNNAKKGKTLLLEFGVGFNTPAIIRFPFESIAAEYDDWNLVRFNKDNLELVVVQNNQASLLPVSRLDDIKLSNNFQDRYIPFSEDIELVIDELLS
jgi:NAD-dependent SIR2 family protein deacetylase